MLELLYDFDQFSFWLGFAAALLFTWLSRRIIPLLRTAWRSSLSRMASRRESFRIGVEFDYRNDFIRYAQGLHLAAPLFSLDEILVPPSLLSPPPQTRPGEEVFLTSILSKIIPYMPDVPEFSSVFGADRLTLAEALSRGANLAVFGPAGSGKTTALAHLGTQIASLSPDAAGLVDLVPYYVHAADISLPVPEETDPFDLVRLTILQGSYLSRKTIRKFDELVQTTHRESRALLLLDGLDELAPEAAERVIEFLQTLIAAHPNLRIAAAASLEYFDGLTHSGLHPVSMAAWTGEERTSFIRRWGELWVRHIDEGIWSDAKVSIEPQMLLNWLGHEGTARTPLEITLRTWAVFAGDCTGPTNPDSMDAYLHRVSSVNPTTAETALERIAMQMALTRRTIIHARAAGHWSRGNMVEDIPEDPIDEELLENGEENGRPGRVGRSTVQDLLWDGFFKQHPNETIRFCHPVFMGYFAGRGISSFGGAGTLAAQADWSLKDLAMHYLAARTDISPLLKDMERPDPMQFFTFSASRWLRDMSPESAGRRLLMRRLVTLFQDVNQPDVIRQRAMAALALARDPAVLPFCRKLLTDPDPLTRGMAALGLGFLQDPRALPDLNQASADPAFIVRAASCFALVHLGLKDGIDTVAAILLHGDEDTKRAAAEALAIDSKEGLPLLLEASREEDLLVRRAAVFGLGRTGSRESTARLERMQTEDDQWIVRNAANQEILRLEMGSPAIPEPLDILYHTGWLIAFAGETGEGLAPGRAAMDMLFRALIKGTPEQKMAAMDRYRLSGSDPVWTALHELLHDPGKDVQNAAFQTLWHLRAQGFATQATEPAAAG